MKNSLLLAVLALATTGLGAQTSDQPRAGVKSRLGTASLAQGEFHCAVPGHPRADEYTSCNEIPVIVLTKSDGSCLSLVPYVSLHVHTNRQRTRIVWRIFGSATALFETQDGIKLDAAASDGTLRKDVFESKVHLADRFVWVIKAAALNKKTFKHVAVVKDSAGRTCEEIDPLIVNVEN